MDALAGLQPPALQRWAEQGTFWTDPHGHQIFVIDTGPPAAGRDPSEAVLILHGFPSSSYDWHDVVPRLSAQTRVVTFDMLGYGFSDKPPDARFSLAEDADRTEALAADLGLSTVTLVTHDRGQTVGVELMRRQEEGELSFAIRHAIITNGSTLIDLAQLSDGQQFLLALPDERLSDPLDLEALSGGVRATFSDEHQPSDDEVAAMLTGIRFNEGDQLLPRLIRYVEERRSNLDRWTAALESFSGPMTVIWGEQDPIAVVAMAHRIKELHPDAEVITWPDVGHWPSIEAPERLADEIARRM